MSTGNSCPVKISSCNNGGKVLGCIFIFHNPHFQTPEQACGFSNSKKNMTEQF